MERGCVFGGWEGFFCLEFVLCGGFGFGGFRWFR